MTSIMETLSDRSLNGIIELAENLNLEVEIFTI